MSIKNAIFRCSKSKLKSFILVSKIPYGVFGTFFYFRRRQNAKTRRKRAPQYYKPNRTVRRNAFERSIDGKRRTHADTPIKYIEKNANGTVYCGDRERNTGALHTMNYTEITLWRIR